MFVQPASTFFATLRLLNLGTMTKRERDRQTDRQTEKKKDRDGSRDRGRERERERGNTVIITVGRPYH